MTIKTRTRVAIIAAATTIAALTGGSAYAAWSGSHNLDAGWYSYFWYGGCHFGGSNDKTTAETSWVFGKQTDCIGLRVRYEYTAPAYGSTKVWTGYKYAPTPDTGIVTLKKSSIQKMTSSGHSGRI